jgi:hypothetical protein
VDDIGASDIDMMTRYWSEEPWGSVRDNLHAAIIAREVRSTAYKGEHKIKDFLLTRPPTIKEQRQSVFDLFRSMVRKK